MDYLKKVFKNTKERIISLGLRDILSSFIGSKAYMVICTAVMIICAVLIILNNQQKKQQEEMLAKLAEEQAKTEKIVEEKKEDKQSLVNFDFLHEINPDIYAWIKVPNSNIDYPVLQSPQGYDTDYYLNTNLDGSSGYPGSIYTQLRNSKDFSDPVTIIYGHNMKNGSMFANLHKFEDKDFFDDNPYFNIYSESGDFVYQVFAAIWYDNRLILDYYDDFEDISDYENFLEDIYGRNGNFNDDVTIDVKKDKIIGLSTCISNRPNERFYVFAKQIDLSDI